MRKESKRLLLVFTVCLVLGLVGLGQNAYAIDLRLDYTYDSSNFFSDSTRKGVLKSAAGFFESILTDDLLPIRSSNLNKFDAVFIRPDTGEQTTVYGIDVDADTLVIYAGAKSYDSNILGMGGPGGFSVSYSDYDWYKNAVTRGETNDISGVQGGSAYDFAPWGGSVSFNTDRNWYFDADPSTNDVPAGKDDFYSVALHELAHVLGFGSSDSWENLVDGSRFKGERSTQVYGSNPPLSEDKAHWAEGTKGMIVDVYQEAAMDPTLTVGTRKYFTDLDIAGLDDIGWDISPVPLPDSVWLLGIGAFSLFFARRKSDIR